MQNYDINNFGIDPSYLKRIKEIEDKIESEKEEGTLTAEKETNLNMEKLLRGMQLNTRNTYGNNYRAMFPW